ncbi:MAG TPA: hypothetical protein VLE99_01600 [Candidatus Saccharimonadales bacterium]|nr:hypothetical protein [Candidatus Saccharimonadales bacterium]
MAHEIAAYRHPDLGETVISDYFTVARFDPALFDPIRFHNPGRPWGICDAFSTDPASGWVPNQEVLEYKQRQRWDMLPADRAFLASYAPIRAAIVADAMTRLGSERLRLMIEIKNTGLYPPALTQFDRDAHVDFVGQLGPRHRVLVYHASNDATTVLFRGRYPYAGFLDNYATMPEFGQLEWCQPDNGELICTEGITAIHAPAEEQPPYRIHIRGFAEALDRDPGKFS